MSDLRDRIAGELVGLSIEGWRKCMTDDFDGERVKRQADAILALVWGEIAKALAANHTAVYDLRNDLAALFGKEQP